MIDFIFIFYFVFLIILSFSLMSKGFFECENITKIIIVTLFWPLSFLTGIVLFGISIVLKEGNEKENENNSTRKSQEK